ncbi:kynureninase-like [Ornithodoros turicata]|uniref:kynureninase-like n=1 Tax=Ornithodoros turicata TaxID=34597 RepID=UPI003138E4C2
MERSPAEELRSMAQELGLRVNSPEFAKAMDGADPLRRFRERFCIPRVKDVVDGTDPGSTKECIYLCGHSLGLKPKSTDEYVQKVLDNWARTGVESHFRGKFPAASCEAAPKKMTADLVGAHEDEVVVMNGLTVNLHLLMLTYYKPRGKRCKLVIEWDAFPSDVYAAQSQVEHQGLDLESNLIYLRAREGEQLLREEDILDLIETRGETIAMLLLPGVQYYTGQSFDIKKITDAARSKGCVIVWDLAHAVGNVKLRLSDWNVDLAAWCSYKYLNSGAGCLGAAFVSRRFQESQGLLPALRGWWGVKPQTKFTMLREFDPCTTADVFKLSNCPPLLVAPIMASLEIFTEAGEDARLRKQFLLTGYLELLLEEELGANHDLADEAAPFHIITPRDPAARGTQLSIHIRHRPPEVHKLFHAKGIICDFRAPSVIRLAPVPLYNSYSDVWNCIDILKGIVTELASSSYQTNGC